MAANRDAAPPSSVHPTFIRRPLAARAPRDDRDKLTRGRVALVEVKEPEYRDHLNAQRREIPVCEVTVCLSDLLRACLFGRGNTGESRARRRLC
jgi:hypothetical protein